jgi:hypothetical protein
VKFDYFSDIPWCQPDNLLFSPKQSKKLDPISQITRAKRAGGMAQL